MVEPLIEGLIALITFITKKYNKAEDIVKNFISPTVKRRHDIQHNDIHFNDT
jgi:hypothetical protein